MSTEVNIDSMSNEELEASLKSAVNVIDGTAEAEPESTPEPETTPEPQEVATQEEEDEEKGEEGEEEGNPYRKRIDRLLRKRDTLTEELEKERNLRLELEAKLANKGEDDEESDEPKDVASLIKKELDDRDAKSKSEIAKMKEQETEFAKLSKKIPNAIERKAEILELAEKYPTLTFEAIDRILAPSDHVDPIETNRKNAKRMDTSSRSRADLESDSDILKKSTADQEKFLREQIAKGNMVV